MSRRPWFVVLVLTGLVASLFFVTSGVANAGGPIFCDKSVSECEETPRDPCDDNQEGPFYPSGKQGPICPPPTTPLDACPNIPFFQESVPKDMVKAPNGDCIPANPPVDVCPNLSGAQATVPEGMVLDGLGNCVTEPEPEPEPEDVCPNLDGVQEDVPEGQVTDGEGNCVDPGSITVVNDIANNSDQDQVFTFHVQQSAGRSVASAGGGSAGGTLKLSDGESSSVGNLVPGTYTLTQDSIDDWDQPEIDCGSADSTSGRSTVTLSLGASEHVTCTFHNQQDEVLDKKLNQAPKPAAAPAVRSGVLPFTGAGRLQLLGLGMLLVLIGMLILKSTTRFGEER
jgi:hypothetical protein